MGLVVVGIVTGGNSTKISIQNPVGRGEETLPHVGSMQENSLRLTKAREHRC